MSLGHSPSREAVSLISIRMKSMMSNRVMWLPHFMQRRIEKKRRMRRQSVKSNNPTLKEGELASDTNRDTEIHADTEYRRRKAYPIADKSCEDEKANTNHKVILENF